jgi:hypothetical protein
VEELCRDCVVIVYQYACDQQQQPPQPASSSLPQQTSLMQKVSSNDALVSMISARSSSLTRNKSLLVNPTAPVAYKSKLK